jgi:hypothetical protein
VMEEHINTQADPAHRAIRLVDLAHREPISTPAAAPTTMVEEHTLVDAAEMHIDALAVDAPTTMVEEHINTLVDAAQIHINTLADAAHVHINTLADAAPTTMVEEHIKTLADAARMHINTLANAALMHLNTLADAAPTTMVEEHIHTLVDAAHMHITTPADVVPTTTVEQHIPLADAAPTTMVEEHIHTLAGAAQGISATRASACEDISSTSGAHGQVGVSSQWHIPDLVAMSEDAVDHMEHIGILPSANSTSTSAHGVNPSAAGPRATAQPRSRRCRQRINPGAIARPGDVVMFTQACPIPALRGSLGQAHSVKPPHRQRMRFQLIDLDDERKSLGGKALCQWAEMANTVGLMPAEYDICPLAELVTKRAKRIQGAS